jgi:hypothetical protein
MKRRSALNPTVSAGFQQQSSNPGKSPDPKKKSNLPEAFFDPPNLRLQGLIAAAKRGDADLRPHIRRKEAGADAAFQEQAVRGEKRLFVTQALGHPGSHCRLQGQDVNKIRNSKNSLQVQIAATESLAILQAALQAQGRRGVQISFRILNLPAKGIQHLPAVGRKPMQDVSRLPETIC